MKRPGVLTLGALGVVFGDIGTSPLYALHTAFSVRHNAVTVTPENVYGIISMVLWTITIIVTIKYVLLVIRADNEGQGGILALVALLRRQLHGRRTGAVVTVLGILGAALFFGDAVITPAISVLSAVEGLSVVNPGLGLVVVPVAVGVLALLFLVQPFGTARVSWAFGPVMVVWFGVLAVLGIPQIIAHPTILVSLSPTWAVELLFRHPFQAFVLLGAVVLTVTGAEALYADLGHFSASAIRRAWFWVVLPALALVYLGQGALVISRPEAVDNPLFHLAPGALQIPLVVLATAATIIASQAVISGAFSIARQAVRLSLPRLAVRYTSREQAGQIYVPALNWVLFVIVVSLVVSFGSSASLANAYGFAVTGTLVLESGLFLLFAVTVWHWRWPAVTLYLATIGALEVLLLAANATKILDGGWLPVLLAAAVVVIMLTWRRGVTEVAVARRALEGPLPDFLSSLAHLEVGRGPALAVFPHADPDTTPLALVSCVTDLQIFPDQVVVVRLEDCPVPRVRFEDKYRSERLDCPMGELIRITICVGFADAQDIPTNLRQAGELLDDVCVDPDAATYFLSVLTLRPSRTPGFQHWRERLFLSLARNQANRTDAFHLPPQRTVVLGEELYI